MKRIYFLILLLMLLTISCKNNVQITDISEANGNLEEKTDVDTGLNENSDNDVEIDRASYFTGEIITDGIYGSSTVFWLYFIPDKETRQLIYNDYPIEIGESIPLEFEDLEMIKDLPRELGIYKVKIEADFTADKWAAVLKSIKLTDKIGTIEYYGKTYETNDLDENVQPKDRVCGLIIENVRRFDDGGVMISFVGEIESEGYYNVYPGGDVFEYRKIGKIMVDKEYLKSFPTYKGVGNNFSVWFTKSNELYDKLANHSAIGRGKFKSSNYHIVYNHGMGAGPGEILTEIISLDEKYKGLFEYTENEIKFMILDENYVVAVENKLNGMEMIESNYYLAGLKEHSKIKIASSNNEFVYTFEKSNDDMSNKNGKDFRLIRHTYGNLDHEQENPQIIGYRYFNKENTSGGVDIVTKDLNYGFFKDDDATIIVYEGDTYLGMVADDISVLYNCTQDSSDELARIRINFTGEITLTGKLNIIVDDDFGYQVYFTADSESAKKLPHHIEDTRDVEGLRFNNENLKDILGTEPFSKNCEIKISDYNIFFAATECYNTTKLVSVRYIEE